MTESVRGIVFNLEQPIFEARSLAHALMMMGTSDDLRGESGQAVAVVACSPGVQLERLVARTKLDRAAAEEMIRSQMPLTEKIRRADHVVWNNGGRGVLAAQAGLLAKYWQD